MQSSELTEESAKPHLIADELLKSIPIRTMMDTGEVHLYENGKYVNGGEVKLSKTVEETFRSTNLDEISSNTFINETLGHVKRRSYTKRDEFDQDPNIINTKNGLLDIRSGSFQEHSSDFLSLTQIPVTYDPAATCPRILQFFGEVLYEEDMPLTQELFGYILWRAYPAQKAFMFLGSGGNGKSTTINLIKSLLGADSYSAVSLQELERNRFATVDLFGRLANLYDDLPDEALRTSGQFKMLTGGGIIRGERKFRDSFNFENYSKLIFSANKIPESHDDSDAFFRRWVIIVFSRTFEGDTQNRNLINELTTEEELSGLLNLALQGLARLIKNNWEFSNSKSTEDTKQEYIRKSSPIAAFIMDCMEISSTSSVPKQKLYQGFVDYCKRAQLPIISPTSFFQKLPTHAKVDSVREGPEGSRVNCFTGLKFKGVPTL